MREILFRGKSIKTGKWVYGAYIKHINRTPCPMGDRVRPEDIYYAILYSGFSDWNMPRGIEGQLVNPDTIGQFTGITDKNGKKIFELDIVLKRTRDGKIPCLVTFNDGCFNCGVGSGSSTKNHYYLLNDSQIEVIGNRIDNPELLQNRK